MNQMLAVTIARPGGPEVLELRQVPLPEPGPGEVRIKVKATAVNRLDLLQRQGNYPAPPGCPQDIPGAEYAGVVDATGSGAFLHRVGQRVFGLVGGGSYAQYLTVDERTVMHIPEGMSFIDAAAIPEAFFTAFDAMILQGGLSAGHTVLVSAAGSGVGIAALQLADVWGARAIGTARSATKLEAARAYANFEALVVTDGRFALEVLRLTGGRGVDVVVELAGGQYIEEDLQCTARQGKIVVVGLVAGARCEMDLGLLLRKRLEVRGTVLRSRSLDEKAKLTEDFAAKVLPHFVSKKLKAAVDRVFPIEKAGQAHTCVAGNENAGKVILTLEECVNEDL